MLSAPAAHTGLPPKVEPWRAGRQRILRLFAQQARADGQAAAQALGRGHNVGRDAELLIGVQRAGAAVAGLHLVDDEQDVVLCGSSSAATRT